MRRSLGEAGFSLIELLVVMVIVGILALVGNNLLSSPEAAVRSQAFSLAAAFKLARFESIKRCQDVLVDLVMAGETSDDGIVSKTGGYKICLDLDGDDNCDSADTMLIASELLAPVAFYDKNFPSPVGPNRTASGDPWPAGLDGISFTGNRFVMRPDGSGNKAGTVYLYLPGGRQGISGGPVAVVMNRIGRVRISRWRPNLQDWY